MDDVHASSSRGSNGNNDNNKSSSTAAPAKTTTEIAVETATATAMFPGFRFSPTDEELISYYLKKKIQGSDSCVEVISEVEIWRHEPWDLPAKSVIPSDNEWFFFSPRGRKYPNGSQSRRATESGYWKATGKERNVKHGSNNSIIGTKRTLVFHTGRAPRSQRTHWIMHEYCIASTSSQPQESSMVVCRLRKNNNDELIHPNETPTMNQTTIMNNSNVADHDHDLAAGSSCSKECSNSFNSHSASDSDDEKQINQQELHEAEDWFADIIEDDIVDLDDSADQELFTSSNTFPFQGTANRRLKLRKETFVRSSKLRERTTLIINKNNNVCFFGIFILIFCCLCLFLSLLGK